MLVKVAALADLREGKFERIELDGVVVLAGLVEQKPFVIKDRCPHADVPLSEGVLENRCLTCSAHGWRFDVLSGESLPHPSAFRLKRYPIQLVEGVIYIEP